MVNNPQLEAERAHSEELRRINRVLTKEVITFERLYNDVAALNQQQRRDLTRLREVIKEARRCIDLTARVGCAQHQVTIQARDELLAVRDKLDATLRVSDEHRNGEDAVAAEGEACQRDPEGDTPHHTPQNPPPTGEGKDLVERLRLCAGWMNGGTADIGMIDFCEVMNGAADFIETLSSRITTLEAERDGLRSALIKAGNNAGGYLSDECSTDFLMNVPTEVYLVVERLRTEFASLTTTLEELRRAVGWQPIETAPKDGKTEVIGMNERGHVHKTWFFAPSSRTQQWVRSYDSVPWKPLHWMPLPALHQPNETGGDKA